MINTTSQVEIMRSSCCCVKNNTTTTSLKVVLKHYLIQLDTTR